MSERSGGAVTSEVYVGASPMAAPGGRTGGPAARILPALAVLSPTGQPRSGLVYYFRRPTAGRERASVRSVATTEGAGRGSAGTGES
jgi:hypothetical protein